MNCGFVPAAALYSPVSLCLYLRSDLLQPFLSSEYSPSRALYMAHPGLLWTNVIMDAVIAISYALFFFGIRWLTRKLRHIDYMKPRLWALSAFNIFILSCGAMILLRIITIWHPMVQVSLALKIICAAASLPTAVLFAWRAPAIVSSISRFFDLLAAEHSQAEALRKSEALLDRTNRVAGIGGWEFDLLTKEVSWSAETARIHRMPPGFKPSLEDGINFYAPEYRQTVNDAIEKAVAYGKPWDIEVQLLLRDGSRIWVRVLGDIESVAGRPVRLFGSIQDKTREIEQRLALRRSEILLDRTNRVAGIGGWELDLLTGILIWSNETARMHGLEPGYQPNLEEAIGFFAPEDQAKLTAELDAAARVGGTWDFELTLIRVDGRRIKVRLIGETEYLDGKPVRLFGSVQDKTVEFEQREALRRSEALLDRTNRVAGIGGWELDLTTNEVIWSDETARLHGLEPGHKPTFYEGLNYYAPETHQAIRDALNRAMHTGQGWDLELPLIRADGRRIWVRLIGEVELLEGKAVRLFGSLQDKTFEIEQREALRTSQLFLDRTNRVAGIGGWEFDISTRELVWSDETARIHGQPAGYKPTYEESFTYFPADYHHYIQSSVEKALANGGVYDLELPLVRADGKQVWVRLIGEVQQTNGKPTRIFGSIQDKTFEVEQREALRKTKTFLDRTTRISGVGGWEVDLSTGTVTWSEETYRLHALTQDYTPSVASGLSFYAPTSRPIVAKAVQRAMETGEGWDLEVEFIRADDKPLLVRTVGTAECVDGKPVRLIGAIQDKTVQIQARRELQRLNERITLAMDGGQIGIWDWDIRLNTFICDAWMFRMHGLEYQEGPTDMTLWTGRLHPDDQPVTIAALHDAIENNTPYLTEFRVIWDDGSVHIVQASGKVFRDDTGQAIRMVGIHRDITESRRLANELQQQHELLSVTLFAIRDAVISLDATGNIVWMNGAAERITGWESADAIGKPIRDVVNILYESSRQPAQVHVDPAIARSRRVSIDEKIVLVPLGGSEINIESCATPIYDAHAELAGSVLVIRDITEQLRHIKELEQITKLQVDLKLKDEFLSHVSHELRSPLTSVYSFTSIIADGLAGETTPDQQEYLQIVLKNVLQLQAMIEDLLTVTQSKEGKLPIELQATSIASAILDSTNTAHPAAAAKQITIATMDTRNLPDAAADPTRLRQILIILLDNAVKFTQEGGHIAVRAFNEGSMLRFEVEDNGCGIPLDKRARVFEKLYQITAAGHADTSQAGRIGLGLGLHIARDLVRRQGGNIWVTGAPERGSIFTFTLPIFTGKIDAATTLRRRKADWPESIESQLTPAA